MKPLALSLLLPLLAFLAGVADAEPLETAVKYISASGVYLDAGRTQGLQKGDAGEIRRGDSLIALIEVEFVADNSASCRITESAGAVLVGDRAIVHIIPPTPAPADTLTAGPPSVSPAAPQRAAESRRTRFTGRVATQQLVQQDRGESDRDFWESSATIRAQLTNLFGTAHRMSVRTRSRNANSGYRTDEGAEHRVYELALMYDDPASRVHYGAGRLLSNRMSGIGYLDGAMLDYRVGDHTSIGAFGGAQPDRRTFNIDTDETKAGVYAAYERGDFRTSRLSGTLALAGNYRSGEINREFAYEQFSYSRPNLFLYQSAELNVNRDWRKDAEGSTLSLSNVLLNARYSPVDRLTATLGYDNRTNFRTYETRNTPDSLFDGALRQGWRLGLNVKLPERFYASAEGGLRTRENEGTETRTGSAGLGSYNLLRSGVHADLRVAAFSSRFSEGWQPSLSLAREVRRGVRAGLQLGGNRYTIRSTDTAMSNRWLRLSTDWSLSRHVYGSVYGEVYRGDGMEADRGFAEIGYRF